MDGYEAHAGGLRRVLPVGSETDTTSKLEELLVSEQGFEVAVHHLSTALNHLSAGDWSSANGQVRTFFDAFLSALTQGLFPNEFQARAGQEKRQWDLLREGTPPLLDDDEWYVGGNKPSLYPGIRKVLHTAGSHPGISDQGEATFRCTLVSVAALELFRLYKNRKT